MSKWILVSDRLPKTWVYVFLHCVYPNGNSVSAIGQQIGRRKWEIVWSDDCPDSKDIKAWMPLPAPPKP